VGWVVGGGLQGRTRKVVPSWIRKNEGRGKGKGRRDRPTGDQESGKRPAIRYTVGPRKVETKTGKFVKRGGSRAVRHEGPDETGTQAGGEQKDSENGGKVP